MGMTDILVHMDHYASSGSRLAVAVGLAQRHRARLTGLLVTRHRNPSEKAIAAARDLFKKQVAGAGIEGVWLCVDGSEVEAGTNDIVAHHAHNCDLLVLGQASAEAVKVGVPFDLSEYTVLAAGRPVLIVPYAGTFATVGERVLVAWKAGRESARAVHDALPLLELAQRVEILVKTGSEKYREDGDTLCADLCAHLARHGVSAQTHRVTLADAPLSDVLLNRAFDEGFDLLVTGAYARGLDGTTTLGSVASRLLKEMTVPILMSH